MTAFDDATRIDELSYSLGNGAITNTPGESNEADNFRIDIQTGQITVAPGASLDYDTAADGTAATVLYKLKVTSSDGDTETNSINVDIHVLDKNEGPTIGRTYPTDTAVFTGTVATATGHSAGGRVPTEMSHPEVDRRSSEHEAVRNTLGADTPMRNAKLIDTDLDTAVVQAEEDGSITSGLQAAVYYANDQDGSDETADLVWTLEGRDKDWLTLSPATDYDITGYDERVLSFSKEPDFEMPRDKPFNRASNNNVYEVTLVVTDQNSGLQNKLPVTVKVINSGEDNEPGRVRILNRQPEIGIPLVAELTDPDTPLSNVEWQWHRSIGTDGGGGEQRACIGVNPFAEGTDIPPFRYFLDVQAPLANTAWQAIRGAKGTGATAKYTPDYKASGATVTPNTEVPNMPTETWTNGDIGVRITTDKTQTPNVVTYEWTAESSRCLRVAFKYKDAVDPTYKGTDLTLHEVEGTFAGAERSVKRHDRENKKPEFQGITNPDDPNANSGPDGNVEKTYTVTKSEMPDPVDRDGTTTPALAFSTTHEVLPAVDLADDLIDTAINFEEDGNGDPDGTDDHLTYSLSGRDAKYFVIVGSVDHPTSYQYDSNNDGDTDDTGEFVLSLQGQLSFKGDTKLNFDRPDGKRQYQVTITATDPSGDKGSGSVNVVVNITDVDEAPEWEKPTPADGSKVRYKEHDTGPVAHFVAKNPERPNTGPGVSYSFAVDTDSDDIETADVEDNDKFSIHPRDGVLTFESPPNYEKPTDAVDPSNEYRVAVKATDGTMTVYREITVIVLNMNEAPVYAQEEYTLSIKGKHRRADEGADSGPGRAFVRAEPGRRPARRKRSHKAEPGRGNSLGCQGRRQHRRGYRFHTRPKRPYRRVALRVGRVGGRAGHLHHSASHRADSDPQEAGLRVSP